MRKNITIILILLALAILLSCGSESSRETVPVGERQYVGSVNSNKYHYPECRWAKKIKSENEIWFKDKADAGKHDCVPCKVCKP